MEQKGLQVLVLSRGESSLTNEGLRTDRTNTGRTSAADGKHTDRNDAGRGTEYGKLHCRVYRVKSFNEAASILKCAEQGLIIAEDGSAYLAGAQLRVMEEPEEDDGQENVFDRGKSDEVTFIRYYVRMNLSEELNLTRLSHLIGLSPNYLCTLFREKTGTSLGKFIRTSRLEKAAYLLETEGEYVEDIAAKVGFTSASYFCKIFKSHYGLTPRCYRISCRRGGKGVRDKDAW